MTDTPADELAELAEVLKQQLDEIRRVFALTLKVNKLEALVNLKNYGYFHRGDGTYGPYKTGYPVYSVLVRQIKSLSQEIENEIENEIEECRGINSK
jgi:hypothetical protein